MSIEHPKPPFTVQSDRCRDRQMPCSRVATFYLTKVPVSHDVSGISIAVTDGKPFI